MLLIRTIALLNLYPELADLILVSQLTLMQIDAVMLVLKTYGQDMAADLVVKLARAKLDPASIAIEQGWPVDFQWLLLPKKQWPNGLPAHPDVLL